MLMIKLVDARKGLHEKCVELFNNEKVAESIYSYLCDGIEECDGVELEQKKGEWIPVSERLPDNPKDVLTTLSNGMVCIGRHHSFGKWTFEAASIMVAFPEEAVIAWMPLPEPYKGGDEE